MWWIIVIVGAVFFAILLLYAWIGNERTKAVGQELILERIAKEYLTRRQNGETMDQIADALYKHYGISKPVEFWIGYYNPLPFGNLNLAGVTKQLPEDARRLGEISYSLLCNRGIYPTPREGQGPRDSACEYDAMTKICSVCSSQMVVLEALGKKVDPALWEMMKKWSALDVEIAKANAQWEKMFQKALSEPERPEMQDKIKGTHQSDGLFGTRWLMTMDEALQVLPEPEETRHNSVSHFGKYHGRRATFSYYFENDSLAEISVCLNKSGSSTFVVGRKWRQA